VLAGGNTYARQKDVTGGQLCIQSRKRAKVTLIDQI